MKIVVLLLSFSLLASCTTANLSRRMAFPDDEYRNLAASGSSTVKGQVLFQMKDGHVRMAAENEIFLNPVTSYSNEWYERFHIKRLPLADPDPKLFNYIRKSIVNAEGRFVFENVPPGEYFVATVVEWEPSTGYRSGHQVMGGAAVKRIFVHDGYDVEVVLNCTIQHYPVVDKPVVF